MNDLLPVGPSKLPPILAGSLTPIVYEKVKDFYLSVAGIFEAALRRRASARIKAQNTGGAG